MNLNAFIDEVTRREGKRVSVNRAEVAEVLARAGDVAIEQAHPDEVWSALERRAKQRARRKAGARAARRN